MNQPDTIDAVIWVLVDAEGRYVADARPDKLAPDQAGWERATLAHWLALVPDLEDVSVIVRTYGHPVRVVVLEPGATSVRRTFGSVPSSEG